MKVLVIDVGGSHVKIMVTGSQEERRMDSGPALTGVQMIRGVKALAKGWAFDRVAIGYPGVVERDKPVTEPHNLGAGWVGVDYAAGFGCPVRIINDAAMQALGGYQGGHMLFLGFGTGLGTAMIADGVIVPMEVAHLPYRKKTFEDYVGELALTRDGVDKWRRRVDDVVRRLIAALQPEDVVLGGGNAREIIELPPRCRIGANSNAFPGGFRLWGQTGAGVGAGVVASKPAKAGKTAKPDKSNSPVKTPKSGNSAKPPKSSNSIKPPKSAKPPKSGKSAKPPKSRKSGKGKPSGASKAPPANGKRKTRAKKTTP